MITDIPTENDFSQQSLMFFNFAYDVIFSLQNNLKYAEDCTDIDSCQVEKYWTLARRELSIAYALTQQGAELALKSKIAAINPLLLLYKKDLMKHQASVAAVSFSSLKTIKANELLGLLKKQNSSFVFPNGFEATFDDFRKNRNVLFHAVDSQFKISLKEVVIYILTIVNSILSVEWMLQRQTYWGDDQADAELYDYDGLPGRFYLEIEYLIDMLDSKELSQFSYFKNSPYICPKCYWLCAADDRPDPFLKTAQLLPDTPASTNLYCFVCQENTQVERKNCKVPSCRGNVLDAGNDNNCLTCGIDHVD